jgi:ADP-heptose:LPS heptosyltransferase
MALPAIRVLASQISIRVLCRPDCAFLLHELGIEAIPFDNPFFVKPGLRTFLQGLGNALALRSRLGRVALDFNADPRTGFLLKAAGARSVFSYQRPYGWFIESKMMLPKENLHQSERDIVVAEGFLNRGKPVTARVRVQQSLPHGTGKTLIISCWTRKDEKNWSLESWQTFIEALLLEGRTLCILVPPDGDQDFRDFQKRNQREVEFLESDLEGVHKRVQAAAGIVCTDNFLGHMGAYLGRPVFWINGSSDPELVRPYGTGTEIVQLDSMACRPCLHQCINPVYKQCLMHLTPEAVKARARIWLDGISG